MPESEHIARGIFVLCGNNQLFFNFLPLEGGGLRWGEESI